MTIPVLDPAKSVHDILAKALGLVDYCWIRAHLDEIRTKEFQNAYSSFCRLRRPAAWKRKYFAFMAQAREEGTSFEQTLRYLSTIVDPKTGKGRVEMSFASKLVAFLDPSRPIWDSIVSQKFGLVANFSNEGNKLEEAVRLYAEFEQAYGELVRSDSGKKAIAHFDALFPEYAETVSDVKKIDCFLWGSGKA